MIKNYIENANFEDTGFSYTLSLISGKYKMVILYCLMEFDIVRFNELKRYLKHVTDKTLSNQLKELESDRLIIRKEYPQIPPKVEYSLSNKGKSLMRVLDQLCIWGEKLENSKVFFFLHHACKSDSILNAVGLQDSRISRRTRLLCIGN